MSDAILGTIIVMVGFSIAISISIVVERKRGKRVNPILMVLYVLWMVACAGVLIYTFMK